MLSNIKDAIKELDGNKVTYKDEKNFNLTVCNVRSLGVLCYR